MISTITKSLIIAAIIALISISPKIVFPGIIHSAAQKLNTHLWFLDRIAPTGPLILMATFTIILIPSIIIFKIILLVISWLNAD